MASGRYKLKDYYQTELIDNDIFNEFGDITREELQEMEKEEFGEVGIAINWSNWDRITKQTKDQLARFNYAPKKDNRGRRGTRVYVYNLDGQLQRVFNSALEASQWSGLSTCTILDHIKSLKPYNGLYYTPTEMEIDELPKEKFVYVYKLDTKEFIGKFKTQVEASLALGLPKSKVGYIMAMQYGRFYSKNLYFSNIDLRCQTKKDQSGQETLKER